MASRKFPANGEIRDASSSLLSAGQQEITNHLQGIHSLSWVFDDFAIPGEGIA